MEQSTAVLLNSPQPGAESNFLTATHVHSPLDVAQLLSPSASRRAILRTQVSCGALILAALVVAAAYILIPLAMTVHAAMHPVLLAVVLAAAALAEVALIVTLIILRTEGPAE